MSFVKDLRCAMEGARLSPGDWIQVPDKIRQYGRIESIPCAAVRFDPAFISAVPAPKPARRNYKAELQLAEGNLALMKTLIRNLLESYSSGDEEFHAACVADAHVLLAEVA